MPEILLLEKGGSGWYSAGVGWGLTTTAQPDSTPFVKAQPWRAELLWVVLPVGVVSSPAQHWGAAACPSLVP